MTPRTQLDTRTYSSSPTWYQVGERQLLVTNGNVIMEKGSGTVRCAIHLVRMVYNVARSHNECPVCSTIAIVQTANMQI